MFKSKIVLLMKKQIFLALLFGLMFILYSLYHTCLFCTLGGNRKGPLKQGLSVLPSFPPSCRLSGRFLGTGSLVLSKSWHGTRNLYEFVRDRARKLGCSEFM